MEVNVDFIFRSKKAVAKLQTNIYCQFSHMGLKMATEMSLTLCLRGDFLSVVLLIVGFWRQITEAELVSSHVRKNGHTTP